MNVNPLKLCVFYVIYNIFLCNMVIFIRIFMFSFKYLFFIFFSKVLYLAFFASIPFIIIIFIIFNSSNKYLKYLIEKLL